MLSKAINNEKKFLSVRGHAPKKITIINNVIIKAGSIWWQPCIRTANSGYVSFF